MNNSAKNTTIPIRKIKLPAALIGLGGALLALSISSLLLALLLCQSNLSQEVCFALRLPLIALSCLIGGFIAAKKATRRGLYQGIKVALLIIALLAACCLIGKGSVISLALKALCALLGGAIGGILGVF